MPLPDLLHPLPDGRKLAVDDRGDPDGAAVLYLHGTPDSRLSRHPDDSIAARLGVRMLAVDRPGIGDSTADPTATPMSVVADLVHLLDTLAIERCSVLAWSAGAIWATALAGTIPVRVVSLVLAAPLIPVDAYDVPGIIEGANDGRQMFAGLIDDMSADEIGQELAMFLVPPDCDEVTARILLEDSLAAVSSVEGAGDALVASLRASVQTGMTGLERDIAAQAIALGTLLNTCPAPVIHIGDRDVVAPPPMGRWYADRLDGSVVVHDGGHELGLTHWETLLVAALDAR